MSKAKNCFVVMGFGEKTDLQTQRKLDLDKTYRSIIEPAVTRAGLNCIRADDVIHSGVIDKPMYENLLAADLVIADLSTANANAIYELGIRHAMRPHTTIVMAESEFQLPFDLSHVVIRKYVHLGQWIDYEEAVRVSAELQVAITQLLDQPAVDSPVYIMLSSLKPPTLEDGDTPNKTFAFRSDEYLFGGAAALQPEEQEEPLSALNQAFRAARAAERWGEARDLLIKMRKRRPGDSYIIQQLALSTYKSKQPDLLSALQESHRLLSELRPAEASDAETLGLWGAVHKRLWEVLAERPLLDEAILAYERCFYLRNDYYSGINYAFLLNVRSSLSRPEDALTDFVLAERVRRRVIVICSERLAAGVKDDEGQEDRGETFRLRATLIEALLGIGETTISEAERARAVAEVSERWTATLDEQLGKLRPLLAASPRRFLAA